MDDSNFAVFPKYDMDNINPFVEDQFLEVELAHEFHDSWYADAVAALEGNFLFTTDNELIAELPIAEPPLVELSKVELPKDELPKAKLPTAPTKISKTTCSKCGKRFAKPCMLRRHKVVHMDEKPFECNVCFERFTQKSSLQRHEAYKHIGEQKYRCPHCPVSFAQRTNLQNHVIRTHPNSRSGKRSRTKKPHYACPHCACVFSKINSLSRHKRHRHDQSNVANPNAPTENVLVDLRQLQKSMPTPEDLEPILCKSPGVAHSSELPCSPVTCAVEMDTPNAITVMLLDKLNPQRVPTLFGVQSVQRADAKHYLVCEFCAREFRKPYNLIRHRRSHTAERPYSCNDCESIFQAKAQLTAHSKVHMQTEQGKTRKHTCAVCQKSYMSVRQLDKHMKTHTETHSVAYICSQCHATFATKRGLSAHRHPVVDKEMDLLEQLLPAPICTSSPSQAKKKRQAEVVGHTCDICSKIFANISFLDAHERRVHHADAKSSTLYSCIQCPQSHFGTRAALQRHQQRTHAANRSYKCGFCTQTYKTRQHCRVHTKTHLKRLLDQKSDEPAPATF